ncbi:MAG: T9SS type A sorting domain-containing protein [candidate division KSB1 bacterium]|nr:T9SS type A sorting domain-containing protein [candidate division KSB1 bacterium]MDZ7317614.1 T9SS type A sorting domain-containing protein [candidate division KSB1 bacterium]MDZ7340289.1 T9SS type A sorting domain-containing protein [candidate division KSB1 bacterium]
MNIIRNTIHRAAILLILGGMVIDQHLAAQNADYVYYKNFVRHANGDACKHLPPAVSFMVYLNHDQTKILTEQAPRWSTGTDPNIPGNGIFGIELGNFVQPEVKIGDTVCVRFTCTETRQQGLLTDMVTSIPWITFPQTLYLSPVNLPETPQQITLSSDHHQHRILKWQAVSGASYCLYRRSLNDTARTGQARMMYQLIAQHIIADTYKDTTALKNEKYGYILYAVSSEGVFSSHSQEVNEAPVIHEGDDLTIGWIARLPRLDYVWASPNPKVDGWPQVGQSVTWQAVVKNWTALDLDSVKYLWFWDCKRVDSGFVAIPASDTASISFVRQWSFDRHELTLTIDPDNRVAEEEERNNQLSIFTDAISVGFYVEQSLYDYFHQYQKRLNVHANCWEDWAQRHVRRWNQMFAAAIYPDTPQGVLDRIRIDQITVVPDGALPLAGGDYPTNFPNLRDRTVDLQWGFPASLLNGDGYKNHTSAVDNNPFYFEGSLLHELGHARYLIDLYGFNVHDNGRGNTVAIKENGRLIVGTPYMPLTGDAVHYTPIKGLMNGEYTFVDAYSAAALNLIAGHRATQGNYNSPGNIGIFMNDLPQQNMLIIKDDAGHLLDYADVKIYQATGQAGQWYGKYFDDTADLSLSADENGEVLIGRCPFDTDGTIEHDYGKSNAVIILRVAHNSRVGYAFLESTQFNMEYWRGHSTLGKYEIKVALIEPPSAVPESAQAKPTEFQLNPCYPNPFNSNTRLQYCLPEAGRAVVQVLDITGREIIRLCDQDQAAGRHDLLWEAASMDRPTIASGVYFIRLTWHEHVATQKVIYLK